MSKPATDMRLARASEGFTQVIGRGNASLITKDPSTGKCCFDAQIGGGWHYGDGQETDTAWTTGTAPWNYQVVKANYNVFALSQFNQGQIIKWVDPGSGQNITFQPAALQWTNSLNQIQQISMPQSVAAQANDDTLYWEGAFGPNRDFRYQASPLRLCKQLIIDSPSALPATTYDKLELNFIISVSSGVNIMVDGQAWDKKTQKDTAQSIAFQLPGGAVLWSFSVPIAWDSSGLPEGSTTGSMRLKKQGKSLYVSVRFPKAWIDSAVFPIVIDPTVEYQIGHSDNDALLYSYNNQFFKTYANEIWGEDSNNWIYSCFMRWTGVTIPAGATITAAYISFYHYDTVGSPATCKIYFEKAANPAAVTSYSDYTGRTKTTAYTNISTGSGTWWNSGSIVSIVQELVDAYDYSSGAATQAFVVGANAGSGNNYYRAYGYDSDPAKAPILHIEYTEAAAGGSLIIPIHRRRFQTLLVR